ncbi:hypothetical protein BDY24DRAFT_442595 [Mrakia frigida]|uniref:uncharacterized protein n=1 Tax=Mrakia frigida TaxID=29902 RepID=UPI003FCC06E8
MAVAVKIRSLRHIELLLREENTERRSFTRYLHVKLPPSNPLDRSAFAFKLQALLSLVPSLLHLSIEDDVHSDHPDLGSCILRHFSLSPPTLLSNIVALELLVRLELANEFSFGLDAGPDASPSLPIGLKTPFLEVIQGTNDVVESKSRLLVAVGNACLSSKISGFILPSHHPALNASNLSFPERATSRFNKLVEQAWEGERNFVLVL